MRPSKSRQPTLKPQDLLVALKVASNPNRYFTYADLARELFVSASEAHAAVQRAEMSRLVSRSDMGLVAIRSALQEFVVHGVQYAFPAFTGPLTRGMPTGYAGPALKPQFEHVDGLAPVWPDPEGQTRGTSFYPLYPSVPAACRMDSALYEVLTLIDAIRGGAARERELAEQILAERLR